MNDSYLTITGNLCESPKLRQTPSGAVVSELRVACTSRQCRADENRYIDGETSFYRVSCWGYLAANAASSFRKGDRVIAHGRLSLREYEGRDGIRRVSAEIDARAVGHDLLYGTSTFARVVRSSPASALGIGGVDAVIRSASAAPQQPHGDDGLPGDDLQLQPYVEVDGMIIDRDGQIISEQVVAEHVPVIDSQDSNAAGQPGDDELAGSAVG
jgi:single-strand DNA-binding protein